MRRGLTVLVVGTALIAMSNFARAQDLGPMVDPKSPEGAQAITQLTAKYAEDKGNSTAYTADNPGLDIYYSHKAKQVKTLLDKLKAGQPVPAALLKRALNNNHADEFGGY